MTKLTVPPGCTGVELPNGQKLNADRGHVSIDDARVERYARRSVQGQTGLIGKGLTWIRAGRSTFCADCGHEGFVWQATGPCPKCGGTMKQEERT